MLQLRRITSGSTWIPQIDGLRFAAILSVLLFHIRGELKDRGVERVVLPAKLHWLDHMLWTGDRGVGLFFVISGFILARPFLRQYRLGGKPVRWSAYYLRRVTRLEPPYILALLIYTAAAVAFFHVSLRVLLPHLLASMTYLHNLIYRRQSDISFVTWSLEVEVQFYVVAPLLGMLFKVESTRIRRLLLLGLVLLAVAITWHRSYGLGVPLLDSVGYFLAGYLLADLLEYPRYSNHETWAWDLVSLIGWPLIFLLPNVHWVIAVLPLLIVPLYLAAFRGKASNWFFRRNFVATVGGMCYSIYLLHMLWISIAFRLVKHVLFASIGWTFLVQTVLLLAFVLLCSTVYFACIERPCMDPAWPKRLLRFVHGKGSDGLRSATAEPQGAGRR